MARKIQSGRESARINERRRPPSSKRRSSAWASYTLPFQRQQYILFGAGLLVILTGFLMLGLESITLAPLLMVFGYCVGIPLLLLWKPESRVAREETPETGADSQQPAQQEGD